MKDAAIFRLLPSQIAFDDLFPVDNVVRLKNATGIYGGRVNARPSAKRFFADYIAQNIQPLGKYNDEHK